MGPAYKTSDHDSNYYGCSGYPFRLGSFATPSLLRPRLVRGLGIIGTDRPIHPFPIISFGPLGHIRLTAHGSDSQMPIHHEMATTEASLLKPTYMTASFADLPEVCLHAWTVLRLSRLLSVNTTRTGD